MQPDPHSYARILEHQDRCQQIMKAAYHQRMAEASGLTKQALQATREFQPSRALMGGLMGAGLGAPAALALQNPYARAAALGIPALLGAGIGGFTVPDDAALMQQLAANQMALERQQMLEQYGAQLANAETV